MITPQSSLSEKEKFVFSQFSKLDDIESKLLALSSRANQDLSNLKDYNDALVALAQEKTKGFPWLANAFAEYIALKVYGVSSELSKKKHPAYRAAEIVRQEALKRRVAVKKQKILEYILEYYESLFPFLVEFREDEIDDESIRVYTGEASETEERTDPVKKWVTGAEYKRLTTAEKNQLALDRYRSSRKTKWQIGRDYEMYVGYLYERQEYSVYYQGIVEGLADLGRDLIVEKGNDLIVIQCKCWRKEKVIHEKHICQFKGTALKCEIENPGKKVTAIFYTSASLSPVAAEFASKLGIEVRQNVPLEDYPCIKCNVSKRNNEKIYHLPFDQQYDKTIIESERNERFVSTVAEAEKLGFRRAFRWAGEASPGE
jgi:hypothetical protein